jgi:hypothetical protein
MNPASVTIALVSHTNAGKTTLARTLLARDIGEVRDAAHVTEAAERHPMIQAEGGATLWLWDTPGFGDSVRLVRRLRGLANPIGWLLAEVWDRFRDRPFWSTQQALRAVQREADVLLYLVNAADEAAAYLASELELLAWVGRPVLVLLNQTGAPRPREVEEAEVGRWRERLAPHAVVRAVLPLDAFTRCWVQEWALLEAIGTGLGSAKPGAMQPLAAAWLARRLAVFDRSMQALAASLAALAAAREPVDEVGWFERLRRAGRGAAPSRAERALHDQLAAEMQRSTEVLLELHGLAGSAAPEILDRVASQIQRHDKVDEGKAALVGGAVSGALAGIKADLVSGGLTLGGGMLVGALLGALGAAGVARGLNLVRGNDRSAVSWSEEALHGFTAAALLRYLAVAHYGRGRGPWHASEAPAFWRDVVDDALAPDALALAERWHQRCEADVSALQRVLARSARRALARLYPEITLPDSASAAGAESAP